jgi:HEAT repeat protein
MRIEQALERLKQIGALGPLWLRLAVACVLAAVIALVLVILVMRIKFRREVLALVETPQRAPLLRRRYSKRVLRRRSALVERLACRQAGGLVSLLGLDDIWVEQLRLKGRRRDFERVLRYAADKGLFQCFLESLNNKNRSGLLVSWFQKSGESRCLRRLALSGRGEPFEGRPALEIFKERLPELREMTGDPEWLCRYFAFKLLLHDPDPRSRQAVWPALTDPHPLVRKTAAVELVTQDRGRLYDQLLLLSLEDPEREVRRIAWERIRREFGDLHCLDPQIISAEQALHVLELLEPGSKSDESLAMFWVGSDNLELRHSAASFLSRCGALRRLCLEVDYGDPDTLARNQDLLCKASEVNVSSFLSVIRETRNPATLQICARVLAENGDRNYIHTLARKVFSRFYGQPELVELYRATVRCAARRGSELALELLLRETFRWKNNPERIAFLLDQLPARGDFIFLDSLLGFFTNVDFPARDALRKALKRMARSEVLEEVLNILRSAPAGCPHPVRMDAVRLLAELELPYCLQILLENLPLLPPQEAREALAVLARYPRTQFREAVTRMLACRDAGTRMALIAALPASSDRELIKVVRRALGDADPEVRMAAVRSLFDYGDARSVNQVAALLRDPVARVRSEAGRALGSFGCEGALIILKQVLGDEHEMNAVKLACIEGLGASGYPAAVDILVEQLEKAEGLDEAAVQALSRRPDKPRLIRMVELYNGCPSMVQERIAASFTLMRERGEQGAAALLGGIAPSLKPSLDSILEKSGYVEQRIARLAHRERGVRREAAAFLALVGTLSAFRGLVVAARDPDEEVRLKATAALKKLESEEDRDILDSLRNDPDARVRKSALWALERLQSEVL